MILFHGILCINILKEQAQSLSMAPGSNTDDEFDWEAAVAEIDDACNKATLATTSVNSNDANYVQIPLDRRSKQKNRSDIGKLPLRQSTLDKFVEVTVNYTEDHQSSHLNRMSKCNNNDGLYNVESVNSDIDPVAAKTWIYPVNVPLRDYQFSIAKTALFSNTLVSLPTGLGKTLIAAVVMYNYFRWFPTGKIVFTAPSRPLVIQQIEACHNIVGIPQEWTIDMTGQMNPAQRSGFWQSKRVFFVTPQVLEKDIQSSSCLVKQLVCLVVDEAHRAMGNYSYCVVVREIMEAPVQLRILALTATPGSKQATIQTVIDNLHISTLEYRNESDPDVSPYTHNRNIELIPVKINKESVNISSLLLEVTKPVVQKLCSLGVFYSKDVTKLAPIEFLTARDKFRESPPAYLAQMQYGEVEACFGAGITLYHIYKLLFSHGIRPAFEMLQQKLQQGSFARLMGRNETLWQVKLLMQQSLGHGAPNPKVLKMEEIIINHFESNDPGNSRVIIFTNFRESVKDIMESLAKLGDVVKAMEFIGQSSGKASKGQSQKVQQAVLQKFRAGGYNTIVATSIGEEGLDIMEVDLVICFDANVSPIRMIQRMGRTGRKRDGRVVILASEGSELQGYLKKQAKGKALGKHMHNGGINSFNFHCSPRMVPHSYQPDVQFVEMSIEKFVPRGRKSRADAVSTDKEDDEFTESEKNLLAKYFSSGTKEVWKPSLVAFPHYQLFLSQVYKVRHSFRTTEMLIDTLQFLQEHRTTLSCTKNCFVRNEAGGSSTECFPSALDIIREAGSQGLTADRPEPDDLVSEEHSIQLCSPSTQSGRVVSDSQQTFQEVNASYRSCEVDESLAKNKSLSDEASKHESSDATLQDKDASLNVSSSRKTSLHRCLYNTGFVSVNQDGRVIILSPPSLPLLNNLSRAVTLMNGNNSLEASSKKPVSPPLRIGNSEHVECMTPNRSKEKVSSGMLNVSSPLGSAKLIVSPEQMTPEQMTPEQSKVCSPPNGLINVIDSLERVNVSTTPRGQRNVTSYDARADVQTPPFSDKLFEIPKEVVLATPDSCFQNFTHDLKENIFRPLSTADANYVDLSSHVTNLAVRDIVPESPIATTNSLQQPVSNLAFAKTRSYSKSPSRGIIASSWDEQVTYLREKGMNEHGDYSNTEICKTPRENQFVIPADVSPALAMSNKIELKSLTTRNCSSDNAEQLNFECLSISKSFTVKGKSTPLITQMSSSCSEDWHLNTAETEKSVQRQCKFKRLCKRKDDSEAQVSASPSPSQIPYTRKKKPDITNESIQRKSKLSKAKRHSKISAQLFIDEEAEVSSDDYVSTDEDDEHDTDINEGESESDSFIDDRVEPTAASTQSEGDQVDIMAVYRRSLFTQSPLDEELNPWAHFCQPQAFTGSESPYPSESITASVDNNIGSDTRSLATSSAPTLITNTDNKTSSSRGLYNAIDDSRVVELKPSSTEEKHSKMESRKRKLSFQPVDSTGKSNVFESQVPPFSVENLRENLSSSSFIENEPNQSMGRTFDDDLFEGLDLDALEAEATEMARLRSNMDAGAGQMTSLVKSRLPNNHDLDLGCSVKPVSLNIATSIKQPRRTSVVENCINGKDYSFAEALKEKKEENRNDVDPDFLCTPSFDLGI